MSNTVTMAIDPAGATCRDTHNPLSEQFHRGGKVGLAQLLREEMRVDLRVLQPYDVTHDVLAATFRTESPSDYYFNAVTAMPPVGTCTVYSGAASRVFSDASQFAPRGSQINVDSPITVASGASRATAASSPGFEGTFLSVLGGQRPFDTLPPPLLTGGPFSLSSLTFTTFLDNVNPLSWTNRDQVARVRRAEDLELRWSGDPGASRGVAILGLSEQSSGNASSGFACLAPRGATTFVVPAYVLAALPASDEAEPYASARISIGSIPLTAGPALSGFDYAFLGVSKWISKTVVIE